ncbi:MAG: energy transducer TonB [Bacteroidota bacterium]
MKNQILVILTIGVLSSVSAQPDLNSFAFNSESEVIEQKQKSSGIVLGTVIDIDDRSPLDKATVEILGTGIKVTTAKDGQFKISGVSGGFIQIRATAAGYDQQTQNNLYVDSGKSVTAFFMLKKSGLSQKSESEHTMPVPIATKSPGYPEEARKNGVEGIFYFRVDISETGAIIKANCFERSVFADHGKLKDHEVYDKYRQAVNQLEKEALESIWQWKFKPAYKEGKAIMSTVTLPVRFKLSDDKKD